MFSAALTGSREIRSVYEFDRVLADRYRFKEKKFIQCDLGPREYPADIYPCVHPEMRVGLDVDRNA